MRRIPLEGPTIRVALVLGFGLTLGLWLFTGYGVTRRIDEVQRQAQAISDRYTRAQTLLSEVQEHVLLGSVYVRDLLLAPSQAAAVGSRRQLAESYRVVDDTLLQYEELLESDAERASLLRLQTEIHALRGILEDVIARVSESRPGDAATVLGSRIGPQRETVLRVSEEVRALDLGAFVQQQRALSDVYAATQRRGLVQLGFALAAGLGIALVATLYTGRLEDRLRRQRARDAEHARDLQRLSARILTAQEEERRTIARELHDEIGQVLTAIKVELSVAQRHLEQTGSPAHLLEDARAITDNALATVRDLSHLLHPALLDDLGLPAVIDWYARGFSRRHGIAVDVTCDAMEERLSADLEATAYRIVQEALTNVARHARADHCRVILRRLSGTVAISIEDNGVGFDPVEADRRAGGRGLGLIGMRERASEVLGEFRIDSAPGRGTRVLVQLPAHVRAPSEAEEEVVHG
jgi:signal transduction histidine kinase